MKKKENGAFRTKKMIFKNWLIILYLKNKRDWHEWQNQKLDRKLIGTTSNEYQAQKARDKKYITLKNNKENSAET